MKEIIIRTNFNIKVGLGHFFRCKILKEKFEKKNFKVTFITDNITKSKLTKNINILNLNQKIFNYLEDSKLVYEKIKNRDVCLILVDDYRIDFRWEKIPKSSDVGTLGGRMRRRLEDRKCPFTNREVLTCYQLL